MKKDDTEGIDFHAFAKLRGRECHRPLNWPMLVSLALFLAGLFLLFSHHGGAAKIF